GYRDQALPRRDLLVDRDRVLEVAQQDVGLLGHVGDLGAHLLVRCVEEVDHPRGLEGDLVGRLGGADRQRLEEVSWVSHAGNGIDPGMAKVREAGPGEVERMLGMYEWLFTPP